MASVENIKSQLWQQLAAAHLFWSYSNADRVAVSDDLLIEMVLIYLDLKEINQLFSVYPYDKVKLVWSERVVRQNQKYKSLNMLLAALYFGAAPGKQQAMVDNVYNHLQW